jgi:predicted NAD-dependent protein-ADP-ribosyltransferase YbiA (DUF1768 family)
METSILDKYNAGLIPSKTNATTAAIRQVNAQHSPLTKIKTGYDRELEQTPIDDYEEMYLLDKENPEETLKDKSYLKDAWTTFMNSRDQINLMSERAKLAKDINPVLDDIDYELNFLSDKQKLKNLENTIPTLDENSEEYKNAISEYFQLQRTLADRQEQYDSILSKYGEKEGDNIDARIEYLSNSRKSWEEERSKVNEEINNIYSNLRERSENYTPSSEFRIKEQRAQDKPWYSPDYFLYAGPGLTGSSMATVNGYIADALATGALWLGRHYATTGALNAVPGIGAVSNLIGWGSAIAATAASVAGNIYSRHRESLAQVYGAYRSRIEDSLKEQGIDIKQYAEIGRNQLKQQDPNIDVSKISDDEIIDRVISGEININDATLANAKRSLKDGLERVYDNNMALSAMDVAQSALVFAPLGKAMGKIITAPIKTALNPLLKTGTKLSEAAASKYNKLIDAYTGFNARLAYNSQVKNASLQAAKALGRLGFSATGEAFEEANQDVFDYDYISGKYDKKSSSVFQSLMGLADANYRTAKILSGIDTESELANDPQFWNDVKGGFALGLYMGGPTIAYHSGLKTYKDMTANSFVRDVVADHIGKKDAMIKAISYSEMANKKLNYQQNVLDVLENYKYNLPEGITEQDLNDEIATANNIFSLSKSKVNQNIGKTIGYNSGTTEYNTLIGLQHLATIDAQEALDNANQAQEADNAFYTTLENDQMLNHYSPEEKLTAVALTKLNIQKQALEQLKTALESKPEENQQKFGITNESNAVGKSISKEIPNILKDIDAKLNQLSEGTRFSSNFIATPNLVNKGIDSYVNTMIANHDLLVAEHKMNEIFGNTLEDGKLINFNNASNESKKKIGKKIKERIDNYINNSDESSKIVEENAKDVVEAESAKEMSREAANQSDDQQPITNNETQVDNQVATEVEQEKATSPKTPIMDDRATSDIDTKIPVVEKEVKEDEEFPTKGLEELSKEFEETLAKVKEKKQEDTERKPKPEPKPVVETQEDEEDEIEFERADEKALIDLANSEAVSDEDDKKVSETYETSNPEVTEESQVKWARKKIATESKMNKRADMDSETRDLDESLEIEEMVQDKVSHTLFFNPDATTSIYPGTKPGKELAERIKDPNFFNDSFCEFVINKDYTEKGYKPYKENDPSTYDSASIIMLIHHGTGDYAMALKTPSGARTFLAAKLASIPKERLTEEDINLINNANDLSIADLRRFRNAVISTIESATNDEAVVPSTIVRTKGIPNIVRKDGRAVFRPIHEVKGLQIPTEITEITPENVTFGISDGIVKDSDIIGANGEMLPGKGGSGQLFIYPPKSSTLSNQMLPLQLTLQRFDRKQAEFLAELLINYGTNPNSEYRDTGVIAGELIDFMVRFGDATKVTTADKTFNWLKEKQLYIDDKSNLIVGEKTFNIGNLSTQDKKDIVEALMGFHWRVARKNFFRPIKEALPSVYDYFNNNSVDLLDVIPGISLTKDDFISSTPVYTMGVLEKAGIIRSDLDDQLFKDSFAYAEDVQKIPRKINNPEVKEAVENKASSLPNIPSTPEPQTEVTEDVTTSEVTTQDDSYIKEITNDGEIDPLSLGIDEDFDIPTRKVTGNISEVVTPEEIQWFRNKLGLPEDSLHIVEDAIALGGNEYAMGLVRKDSTILWKGAERGTLYHEAFHRVSLLTISPKERKKIYEFYRNRTGFVGSDKQVEEALAEDFRQYMLNKVDPELNLLKRAWKAIKNFISKWVWRTDTSIDNIFNRIDSGYYNRSKQDSAAVNEFLAAYKGAGAPFKIRNHKFKNITNTQFKETVNSLVGALFTLNNIRLRDDLQNLNYGVLKAALKPDITAKLVEKGTITKEQGEVRDEIYNTFDTVFKPEIINKLNEYQIRAVDKQENIDAEIDEKAVGNSVGDQMANYIQEQLSVSVKDNALASIKIFIATMPRTEFVMKQKTNPDGTVTQVQGVAAIKSPVTGLPLMVDFDKSWNTIINEIHSENTFKGMMDKSAKLAKVAPLFKTLYNELYKVTNEYVQKKGIQEDEAQKIARENLQTQFRNTFRKARHKLVGILSEKVEDENGSEQTNLYVKDENANKVSKNILEGWNYSLITNGSVLDTSDNLFKAKVSESEEFIAREINNEFNKIIKVVEKYKTTPNKKLVNGQTYKEYVPEKLITIKNKIVDLLNKVGVEIDLESLNSFLTKEYYNSDPTEALVSMLSDRSNKSIYFFFNSKVKDLAKIQESGVIPGQYNRSITKYYADSKFLGRLAETCAMLHPSSDELSVLATDGKLLYPISEHNYLSDMVQRLDNDPVTVEALTKVLYNTGNNDNPNYFKGSVLLTNLYNNADTKGKIGFETLVYFKEQGSADKGRKYTEISPLEDYIAKMTFTRAGRIILPTMGDSQTYNTLYGTAINNFKNPFDVSNGEIKFDAQILKRFINYFETELDTIEFNYKNEKNLTEEQKIKNYDTGNRNGYRFRYFNGFFKLKERPTLNGIEFEKDFSNFNEALDLAEDLGGNEYGTSIISQIRNNWNKFSNAEKANLMNNYLWDAFKDELNYAQELGIIKWDGNKIASVTSLALPQKALEEASSHYKKSTLVSNYSENLGAAEMIGNYFANTISSVIEFEKLFIKDPAYYKNPVDKIKRLREVLSTGVTPRIDYEEGNPMADLTEVNVGTLSDNVIVSRQADQIAEYAKRSAAIRLLQEMHNMTLDEAIRTYDSSEALPQDVEDAANLIVRDKFDGYLNPKGKVNQTDATVLISPEFYKELVRRVDGWTPQVAKAFDLLNDPNADLEADVDTYAEALAVTLKPLKFMYFGDHYDVGAKRDIPIFDKMAMFPVHRIFSTGDMGKVLEVMQSRNIHMLAFDSAVKVGQRAKEVKSRIYKDKTNKEIDMDSLMSMPTHKQSLTNFRRQLITDPHHAERQMFVSQAQKAAMGNIRSAWKYTTPDGKVYNGDELINNFNGAHNAITEAGRREIERDFGITPDKPQVSVQRFAEIMQRKALSSNMNDNVINGLDVENGETVAPISGLSDNSWIESGLISMLNKSIVDTNLPGGMFIQMSSILYNRIAVTSDAQNERKLRFANTDGTMDCVISINLLKHIIPDYDKKTFSEAKKWLIDRGVVGPNSKALAMGYRIPAQGQASTAALKVVDLYPEQIGDTITLPDEFTSLTGSDFDIDKLFVARYNYDKNGNRIKFETKEDYTNRLREAGLDDETIVRKVYERYNGKTDFEANSKEANENMLLDMYISVISNPLNFAEARQPLDTVTDYLKDTILKEVDTITGQGKRTSKSQLYYATPTFQSRTKAELNGGKFGIGPFALANAHQVLTQLVKLRFKPNKILRDYGISNLYGIQSNDRNKINILDWLSALINAHVDVAKDPYIIRLNVRKLTFNMTNFLIRSGKGESTFYFLPQQILKDFAIEYDKYSGFYNVDTQNKNPESLAYRTIWNTYFEKAKSLSKGKYDQLLDFLNDKGVGVKQRATMFDVNYLKKQLKKEETFDWYYNQLLIMKTYQELNPFSRSLSELTTLSQIDTKRFGNNFGLQSAFLDKWKQFMVEQQVFEDPIKVFSNTFLGKKMQDALIFPRIAFQNTMIRLTPEFENLRTLIEFYTKGYAISDDTYINNITRSMEATYKAGFFNKYLAENGIKLSSLLGGPNSISKRLDKIKSDVRSGKYPDLLSSDGSFENVLINNIFSRPKEDTTELNGPDFIAYKPNKSGDNNLENEIIRAWEELWDSDYQEIRDFAKDLALYAFYTSGDAFGKNNIFRYVPNSIREEIGYFDYIRDLERNPDDAVKDIKVFQVIKDLWWNDHVVPTIDYYVLDSSRETIEEEGRPVYRALPHEDSGFTVVNKKGVEVQIPGIIYDKKSQSIISFNQNGQPIYPPFKKVKLDRNNDPRTTFLYEYIGINEDEAPVYRLINKKGIAYRGNVLIENGRSKSVLKYNNVVPKGYEIMPEEPITWVTDLTPVKASLQAKAFNQAGEFNTDMFANIQQTVKTQQATEPLSYQEWVKDYQTQKGEADAEAAYQQYLDNFEYSKPQETQDVNNSANTDNDPTNFNDLSSSKAIISSDATILTNEELRKLKPFIGNNPRIGVASEYTDPAFFSKQIIRVLNGEEVISDKFGRTFSGTDFNALYIITKHDGLPIENLLKHKIPKIIHFSITGLGGTKYEPGVMKPNDLLDRIQAMLKLGLDPESVTIRIDPIVPGVTSTKMIENIVKRASEMGIKTIRFSIMDQYKTTKKYMEELGYDYSKFYDGVSMHARDDVREQIETFMDSLIDKYGVTMSTCAEPLSSNSRIKRDACLSVNAVNNMLGTNVPQSAGTGKRKLCSCFGGKTDLLKYDNVCASSCAYCYAHHNNDNILKYYNEDGSLKDIPLTRVSKIDEQSPVQLNASEQPSGTINIYAGTGENADLSNFAIRPFTISGDKPESSIRIGGNFQTVEGAFQAQKLVFSSMSDDEKEAVKKQLETASGSQAKSIGRKIKDLNTVFWDKASSDIMRDLLLESFSQNPEALNKLLSTGDATLTHTQDKGKWGTEFPKILMEVRELLRNRSNIEPAITDTTKGFSLEPFINKIFPDWKSKLPNLPEELATEFMSWSIVPGIDAWTIKERIEKYKDFEIEEETREAIKRGDKEGIVQGIANTISYELAKDGITERDLFINLFGQSYVDKVDRYVAEIKAKFQKEKDTTKEFLDYANQFGFTDEAALLAKDLPKASEEAKKVEEEYVFTFNDGFKINLPFSLNDQQKSALYELEKFIEDGGTEITLSGYAGTGKSTIIGIFSKWLNNRIGRGNIVYTAPTHRANVITKQNNPSANVYTLSALFGFTPDTDEAMERESLDLNDLKFRAKNQMKYEPGQLIIIDEASMVQDGLYEYVQEIIAKYDGSVIYVGDSAQLRPVKSDHISKVFTSDGVPQITLTKVERTGDNPILKEATRIRQGEGLSYQTDINDKGQGVLYTSNDTVINENLKQIISSEEFNADPLHFRVITATNAAAATYNSKIRSLRYGKFAKPFVKGDILMGYSNKLRKPDGSYRLINSMDYIVQNVRDTTVKFRTDKGTIEFKAFNLSIRPVGGTIMNDFQLAVIDKNEPDSKIFEIVEYKDRLFKMAKEAKQNGQISKSRDLNQMAYSVDNELNITKNLKDNQGRLKIRKAIDYGYAQTVWKSQGSTYSKVLILSNEIDTFGYGRDVMQLRNELRYVAVSRAKNFVIINSEAENKKKVSMRNEIAEEDLLDDIEFEPAAEEQAIKASLQDSIDELTANGKQRRKECE